MATKLWTLHFMRICLANLLLFMSLYLLYPVLPVMMASRLGVPVSQTGVIFILFTLAMFFIGPFHAYLVDVYKRKYICMLSFGVMVAATAGYTLVQNATHLLMLCIVQGLSFGMAATAGITLAIDITNSTFRSAGNVVFSWAARLGMIIGAALGGYLFRTHGTYRDESLFHGPIPASPGTYSGIQFNIDCFYTGIDASCACRCAE